MRSYKIIFSTSCIAILQRAIATATGIASLLVVSKLFSREEQGFHYTMASLAGLQAFLDLGLFPCLVQLFAHEHFDPSSEAPLNISKVARTKSLLLYAVIWYSTGGLLLCAGLLTWGTWFLSDSGFANSDWQAAWTIISINTTAGLVSMPFMACLEGWQFMKESLLLRLCTNLIYSILFCWFAFSGLGLLAPAVAGLANWLLPAVFLPIVLIPRMRILRASEFGLLKWKTEIVPFQLKVAASSLFGYFIRNAYTPTIFAKCGAIQAGQWGLATSIVGAISGLASVFSGVIYPRLGLLVSQRKVEDAWNLAYLQTIKSAISYILLCIPMHLFLEIPTTQNWLGTRLPTHGSLAIIELGGLATMIVIALGQYLRAFRSDPLWTTTILCGAISLLGLWITPYESPLSFPALALLLVSLLHLAMTLFIVKQFNEPRLKHDI